MDGNWAQTVYYNFGEVAPTEFAESNLFIIARPLAATKFNHYEAQRLEVYQVFLVSSCLGGVKIFVPQGGMIVFPG